MTNIISNSIGMEFVSISGGSFTMGGAWDKEQADENELPKHDVTFETPFYIGRVTVTQSQWSKLMDSNPSQFVGEELPVETVSHTEACNFIHRLNEAEQTDAYRLPTEAEWEYTARAGSESTYCFGPERMKLSEYAWYGNNSDKQTHPVGLLRPNAWGLFDMHGNVHEWCSDWYDREYYAASPGTSPEGPPMGLARVLRGGDWGSKDWYCRCAIRSLSSPDRRSPRVGFRVVKTNTS